MMKGFCPFQAQQAESLILFEEVQSLQGTGGVPDTLPQGSRYLQGAAHCSCQELLLPAALSL